MISSSAGRVRPVPLLLAALLRQETSLYCCSRREALTACQTSGKRNNGSAISVQNGIGGFKARPIHFSIGGAFPWCRGKVLVAAHASLRGYGCAGPSIHL